MTDEIPRFDLASQRPTDERIESLRAQFPEVFGEDKIEFDALKRSLGEWVDPGPERFGLTWPGKAECMRVIQERSIGALVPMSKESVDWNKTQNVIIEGENLEVLKLLQKAYYGKVKLIYIDPPYNTGGEFIYPDNFREGLDNYLRYSGQIDDEGFRLRAKSDVSGRFHSRWLSMMYPRLFLARNLLSEDGVLLVSIDDHEVHHLRSLLDEIFGEENFVGTFVWQAKKGGGGDVAGAVADHEYVVAYARSGDSCELGRIAHEREPLDKVDDKGPYRRGRELNKWGSNSLRSDRPTMFFPIPGPDGQDVFPIRTDGREGCWRKGRPEMMRLVEEGEIEFSTRSDGRLGAFEKVRDAEPATKPFRTWLTDSGTTAAGTKRVKELFGGTTPFPYPKPVELLRSLIRLGIGDDDDAIVVDFFAGSGTVADAVLQHNWETGSAVRYLLVQLPEPTDHSDHPTIGDIARERTRRAADSIQRSDRPLDGTAPTDFGFRAFRLTSSNFLLWDPVADDEAVADQLELQVDHVVPNRGDHDVLVELLLKAGFSLTAPVNKVTFSDVDGYSVAEGALLVCLSRALTIGAFEAMVDLDPAMILVLDAGFGGNDELKVNALQTVRARNQQRGSDIALRVV